MGCIGKDSYGEILEKKAREDGVDVKYQVTTEEPTGEYTYQRVRFPIL